MIRWEKNTIFKSYSCFLTGKNIQLGQESLPLADLSRMALSRTSATTPTVDSNPRRCDRKDFLPKSVATTRSIAA